MSQPKLTRLERAPLSCKLHCCAVCHSLLGPMSTFLRSAVCPTLPVFCPGLSVGEVLQEQEQNMASQGDTAGPSLINLHMQSYRLGAGSIVCACIVIVLLICCCCWMKQYCPCLMCPVTPPPPQFQAVGQTGGLGGGVFPSAPPPVSPSYSVSNLPDVIPPSGRPRVSVDKGLIRMLTEDSTYN